MVYVTWAQGDRHIWDISPGKREPLALCLWLAEFAFLVCGGFTKVSVLLFYRRLVAGTYNKLWRYLVLFAIGFTVAYTIAFCVMLLINCTPTEAYWKAFDPVYATTQKYTCLDTKIINTLAGVFAAASDLYSVALPCIITWHFSVPRAQKIALNIIFCLGLLVVAASGVRTYYLMSELCLRLFDCSSYTDTIPQSLATTPTSAGTSSISSSGRNSNCSSVSCAPPHPPSESSSDVTLATALHLAHSSPADYQEESQEDAQHQATAIP